MFSLRNCQLELSVVESLKNFQTEKNNLREVIGVKLNSFAPIFFI
jgi:hypothetical protein